MDTPVISDRFTEQCAVVYANNNDTCGGATRENIAYFTPDLMQTMFAPGGLWAEMDAWFETAFEMKACGTRTYSMYDWIMANTRQGGAQLLQKIKQGPGKSLLQPFILARQSSIINDDYWNVSNGWQQNAYSAGSTGPLTSDDLAEGESTDRVVRVTSSNGIELVSNWFNPGMQQFIVTNESDTVGIGMWQVLASAAATNGSYVDVLLRDMNGGATQSNYDSSPTSGLLVRSTNNVNDFEKWCHNEPNYDGRKLVPMWIKTFRRSRCVDSEYLKFYARLMSGANKAFKEFGDLPLAERNAQDELHHKKAFVNNFFFSVPSDANQNINDWQELEEIRTPSGYSVDPGTGGKLIALRAENIGVLEQLRRCNRVRDLQNQPLNFYEFLNENYRIMRSRGNNPKKGGAMEIDWYTDSTTAANIHRGVIAYWKKETQETLALNHEMTKTNTFGMKYRSYSDFVFPTGLTINIIVNDAFDDWVNAGGPRILTALDLGANGTVYWLQVASNRKQYTTGEVDNLAKIDREWACVMESVSEERTLHSDTGAVVVECPQDQLWIWGIANETPDVTGVNTENETPYYHDLI